MRVSRGYEAFVGLTAHFESMALLAMRLLVARVFWRSGLGKVETFEIVGLRFPTWKIEQATFQLFAYEFFDGWPLWLTDSMAVMATLGELILAPLLAFGLVTRVSALGLLAMTAMIQIFVFPQEWWSVHAWWAAGLAIILTRGPGVLSLDRLLQVEPKRI